MRHNRPPPGLPVPSERAVRYQQRGMPRNYWVAAVLFGAYLVASVVLLIRDAVAGEIGASAWAVIGFTTVLCGVIPGFGRYQGYGMEIEGDDLVWRAPLRSQRVPLADLAGFATRNRMMHRWSSPEVVAVRLLRRDGSTIVINVPDRRHHLELARFFDAVAIQAPGFHDLGLYE